MTIVGKTNQTGDLEPNNLATGVFRALGISVDKKLTKEQFIDGQVRKSFCFHSLHVILFVDANVLKSFGNYSVVENDWTIFKDFS